MRDEISAKLGNSRDSSSQFKRYTWGRFVTVPPPMQSTTQHRFQAFTARMLTKTFGFCGNPLQLWWRVMGALWSHYSAELKFKIQPYSLSGGLLRGVTDPRSLWRIAPIPIGPYKDFIFLVKHYSYLADLNWYKRIWDSRSSTELKFESLNTTTSRRSFWYCDSKVTNFMGTLRCLRLQ